MGLPSLLAVITTSLAVTTSALSSRSGEDVIYASDGDVSLASDGSSPDTLILDFGENVEGHPVFEVVSATGDTSRFEVSYAESIYAFDSYMSDGPLAFAAAMDSYRVKRYNISEPSAYENRLIQGSFRYQKLNLSTAGELILRNVGVKPTVHLTPLTELPGSFECSDEDLTRIWAAGARTAQLTEIPKDTIPDFWVVSEEGSLVDSLVPQALADTSFLSRLSYHMSFDVEPLTGVFDFGVLLDSLNVGIIITCDFEQGLVSASFESKELANASFPVADVRFQDGWVSVTAVVDTGSIQVTAGNTTILSFSQTETFVGSVGLGAPINHVSRFRNLVVEDLEGETLYTSSLTSTDNTFLDAFMMGNNPADTIVDGSRRDRIAYNGDLDIALAVTFASTYGTSFVEGSLDLMGSFQITPGFFAPTARIQQPPRTEIIAANMTGLIGYSFNLVTAFAQRYTMMGDVAFAEKWAHVIIGMLDWADSQLVDGVFTHDDPIFTGDWNYYDPPQTGASSKFNAVYAYALQQSLHLLQDAGVDTEEYQARLDSLRKSIHAQLWDSSLGAYVLSSEIRSGFAQDAQALAILAGVPQANNVSVSALLATMHRELLLPAGPLAFTNSTAEVGFAQKISPYASSYHLRAAFEGGQGDMALDLLKHLWAPMADPQNANYTNTFWETLDPDGTPGLGIGTSLCHGWAAGPTAELTKFVLGIQPQSPGFASWSVKPMALGLSWAKGRQPTERGPVNVDWRFDQSGLLRMNVTGPSQGEIHLPESLLASPDDETVLRVNGEVVQVSDFPILTDGGEVLIEQSKAESNCQKKRGLSRRSRL